MEDEKWNGLPRRKQDFVGGDKVKIEAMMYRINERINKIIEQAVITNKKIRQIEKKIDAKIKELV